MPSGQETDWAYSITTVPGTHTCTGLAEEDLPVDGASLFTGTILLSPLTLCHAVLF